MIREAKLKTGEKLLLMVLADYCGDDGIAFCGQDRLAADVGVKPRQLRNLVTSLRPVVQAEKRGRGQTNVYRINWQALESIQDDRQCDATQKGRDRQPIAEQATNDRQPIAYETGNPLPTRPAMRCRKDRQLIAAKHKGEHKPQHKEGTQRPGGFEIEFPENLDTPEARQALDDWLHHKRQLRKPYKSAKSVEMLLRQWGDNSPAAFVAAVEHSIASNYQGVYPPSGGNGRRPKDRQAGLKSL